MAIRRAACAAAFVLAAIGPGLPSAPVAAQSSPAATDTSCTALAAARLDRVEIVSAALQPAQLEVPGAQLTGLPGSPPQPLAGLPAFCRVIARAHPEAGSDILFEVWMPVQGWNGKFFGTGNGGFAGPLEYMGMAGAIRAGYATASTDTGHSGDAQTSSWARGNPQKVRDYGWRGVHLMTLNAKALTAAYYGRTVDYSYFSSCSNGGRQALMEASRFPEDYDGIVAGAPAVPFTQLVMSMIWTQQMQALPGAALRPEQAQLLQDETIRQCDGVDGQSDGRIDDPRMCRIDLGPLACGTSASAQCLAPAQLTALERMQQGPRNSRGISVAPPYLLAGAEVGRPFAMLGWEGWIMRGGSTPPSHSVYPTGILRDLIQQPFAEAATFDWDRDPARLAAAIGREIDVAPNLSRYFSRGGRLIVWHGWADAAIPGQNALAWNAEMLRRSGRKAAGSSRLFMIPGMQHCFGGNGAVNIGNFQSPTTGALPENDVLSALIHWVERGRAPESLIARASVNPMTPVAADAKQRLICASPNRAVLRQGANPDRAASYSCQPAERQ